MCGPFVVPVAMAAMQVTSGIMQAQAVKGTAKANANALRAQGDQELTAANIDANNLRYQGNREGSAILAQQGASGVALDSGSAAAVGAEHARNVELDAMRVMYGGVLKRHNAYAEATAIRKIAQVEARNAILGGLIAGVSTANRGGLFKTSTPAK